MRYKVGIFLIFLIICGENIALSSDNHDFTYIYDDDNKVIMIDSELYEIQNDGSLSKIIFSKDELEPGFGAASAVLNPAIIRSTGQGIFSIVRWLWKHMSKIKFIRKIRQFLFPRNISSIEKNILKNSKIKEVNNKPVAQRDNIIDVAIRCSGKTSCDSMKLGNAPFDKNCKAIQLHHILQEEDGIIMEILFDEHSQNYSDLHNHTNMSEIQRADFDKWRRQYWQKRATQFCLN
ncbi:MULTISPECIES: HNH/ENDO VII family nuclease [unclassified Desulfovibrio]|uniref:HNH/ENDO VII family nuclease n=1 Tax=unclassified Desulfovibrio TaxID=2593640 RepID=UPI0013EE3953|nr:MULTISPECIES: HNH/ENDO VII family nuclease [unclassified Desulfovibrio]